MPLLPPHPRTRQVYDEPKCTGYEVVLDVFPDVIAYGILLVPKDIKPGERRPVVVCQHGLEGRPQDVVGRRQAGLLHQIRRRAGRAKASSPSPRKTCTSSATASAPCSARPTR